jgi:hypothetical protein
MIAITKKGHEGRNVSTTRKYAGKYFILALLYFAASPFIVKDGLERFDLLATRAYANSGCNCLGGGLCGVSGCNCGNSVSGCTSASSCCNGAPNVYGDCRYCSLQLTGTKCSGRNPRCNCGGSGCGTGLCGWKCTRASSSQPCGGKGCRTTCNLSFCQKCSNACKRKATPGQCMSTAGCFCVSGEDCIPGCSDNGCCSKYDSAIHTTCSVNCHCGCLMLGICAFNPVPSTCYFCYSSLNGCSPTTCINTY